MVMHVWWKENSLYYGIHYYNISIIISLLYIILTLGTWINGANSSHFKDKIWNQVQMQFNLR